MNKLLGLACCCLWCGFVAAADSNESGAPAGKDAAPAKIAAPTIDGGYAVVVSKATAADPQWSEVVQALQKKYGAQTITYDKEVSESRAELAKLLPRYACFVARPEEAGRQFVIDVHRLTRKLDSDPYMDVIWGILTGYDATDALHIASRTEPLVIHKGSSGSGIPLEKFDEAVQYCNGRKGIHIEKTADGKIEEKTNPDDSTKAIVDLLNDFKPDFFLTSGHATERDWQIGYTYKNGQFRCKDGVVYGLDLQKKEFPVNSPNPKIYLPLGNCLMGHIPDKNAMAVAFMHSCGVYQMCGHVVSTWYGYGSGGIKDYLLDQPGRFSLAESYFANNQSLVHQLETRFPKTARVDLDKWNIEANPQLPAQIAQKLGYDKWNDDVKDNVGLLWDRDTIAFYGDPAWDARMPKGDCEWDQTLAEKEGTYTFQVTAKADVEWKRPPFAFLPHRLKNAKVVSGQEFEPTVSGLFVMLSSPKKLEKGKSYTVVFKAGESNVSAEEKQECKAPSDAANLLLELKKTGEIANATITKDAAPDKEKTSGAGAAAESPAAVAKQYAEKGTRLPAPFRHRAVQALTQAKKNGPELLKAIEAVPAEHAAALAFLLANMPASDLTTISSDFLLENIDYAYRAREAAPWSKELSDELFMTYILPYANVNERRDNWRKDFFEQFSPAIKECKTSGEAALLLNKAVFAKTNVKYHATKRPKPDQSPQESIAAGYASCTGLSIMIVDACRAVGIPARVVGTQWTNVGGNHTWSEVWDHQWNFLASSEGNALNKGWFVKNASQADASRADKRIYASAWFQTGVTFPLVWAPENKDVAALDVTSYYTSRDHIQITLRDGPDGEPQKGTLVLRDGGALVATGSGESHYEFDLARRKRYVAEITLAEGKPIVRDFFLPSEGDSEVVLTVK